MNFYKILAATAAVCAMTGTAQAQDSQLYANVGAEYFFADADDDDFNAGTLLARLGYNLTENFAIEGQAAFGIIDDEFEGVDFGVDTSFGGFIVAKMPAGDKVNIFGRAGYHFTEISADAGSISVGVDTDGFALGAGLEYMLNDSSAIRADYTYYDMNGDVEGEDIDGNASGVSLAYVFKF